MRLCRICFEGDKQENLISPCRCSGTISTVHPSCMEHWLKLKAKIDCEICHTRLNIRMVYPAIPIILIRFLKELWKNKRKMLKIIFVLVYGHFLYKKLTSIKQDLQLISSSMSWIKRFGLKTFFAIYYSELLIVFFKFFISMTKDIIELIKSTSNMSIANYQ